MFRHPVVYSPLTGEHEIMDRDDEDLISYEPYAKLINDDDTVQSICGEMLPPAIAKAVSEGWVSARRLSLIDLPAEEIPEQVKKDVEEWVKAGGPEKIAETRKRRKAARIEELHKIKRACDEKVRDAPNDATDTSSSDVLQEAKALAQQASPKKKPVNDTPLEALFRKVRGRCTRNLRYDPSLTHASHVAALRAAV